MKRFFAVFLCAVFMLGGLCACSSEPDTIDKTAADVADAVFSAITFKDTLIAIDSDMLSQRYSLDESLLEESKLYVSGTWSTAEEIAVFKLKDKKDAEEIKKSIETRLADLKLAFENYVPGELKKIEDPAIVTKANFVVLVLSDDTDGALKQIEEALK